MGNDEWQVDPAGGLANRLNSQLSLPAPVKQLREVGIPKGNTEFEQRGIHGHLRKTEHHCSAALHTTRDDHRIVAAVTVQFTLAVNQSELWNDG